MFHNASCHFCRKPGNKAVLFTSGKYACYSCYKTITGRFHPAMIEGTEPLSPNDWLSVAVYRERPPEPPLVTFKDHEREARIAYDEALGRRSQRIQQYLDVYALPEPLKEDPAKSSFERAEEALQRWPDLSLRKLAQRANTHYSTISRVRKRMRQEGTLA